MNPPGFGIEGITDEDQGYGWVALHPVTAMHIDRLPVSSKSVLAVLAARPRRKPLTKPTRAPGDSLKDAQECKCSCDFNSLRQLSIRTAGRLDV